MNHTRFGVRVKHFRLMLQQFLRDAEVHFSTVRPHSQWTSCFKVSISFSCTDVEHGVVEQWLSTKLSGPATGTGRELESLGSI